MAAIITAVVIAGRTGAAFAAEIATMQANEEVDALEVLGLTAIDFLVLPRVGSLLLMMPLLYIFACVAGLLGGMIVAAAMLDLSAAAYLQRTAETLTWTHLGLGIGKSVTFGALVGMVGCYYGLRAQRNAAGVGVATTGAVVTSIVGIIVLDAIFAVCANALEYEAPPKRLRRLPLKGAIPAARQSRFRGIPGIRLRRFQAPRVAWQRGGKLK